MISDIRAGTVRLGYIDNYGSTQLCVRDAQHRLCGIYDIPSDTTRYPNGQYYANGNALSLMLQR